MSRPGSRAGWLRAAALVGLGSSTLLVPVLVLGTLALGGLSSDLAERNTPGCSALRIT